MEQQLLQTARVFNIKYIILIMCLLLIPIANAETTFFDNPDDSFIIANFPVPPTYGGINSNSPVCHSLWVCETWSECSNTLRSRTCVDIYYCNSNEKPPFLLSCSQPLPTDRIDGCVTFAALDSLIIRWKLNVYRFDILDEGIRKWKHNTDC